MISLRGVAEWYRKINCHSELTELKYEFHRGKQKSLFAVVVGERKRFGC